MKIEVMFLPHKAEVETKAVLKRTAIAQRFLAELKGLATSMPNQNILIDTLALQEARESSAIENIVSTFDDVFQSHTTADSYLSLQAKEIHDYAKALKKGFELVDASQLITLNTILEIQLLVENNKAGFRKLPGTKLINEATGETVYEPPQDYDTILKLMGNLEIYMNDNEMSDADPLVKMAITHHQFETIHPFYDGNGRTGRIINILYLIKNDLLTLPILYLSRYIIRHKSDYYLLLQHVRSTNEWESWILYMLDAIIETSKDTISVIKKISKAMQDYKHRMRNEAPKIYSQDLLNNIFQHPYTKIEYFMQDLNVSRNTAIRYLEQLESIKLVTKIKVGRDNYFVNNTLVEILKHEIKY